jgi:hypothetical protein
MLTLRCINPPVANCKEGKVLWNVGETCEVDALSPFWEARIADGSVAIVIEKVPDPELEETVKECKAIIRGEVKRGGKPKKKVQNASR